MPRHFHTLAVIVALAAFTVPSRLQTRDADLVIVNAKIFTGVPATPWAEALSVIGDRIGVVGTTAAVRKTAGSSTRVIDAAGRTVVPGINDAHVHVGERPPGTGLEAPPAMQQDPSLEEILTRLKAAVAKAPGGGWIYGEIGARVIDDPEATRQALDKAAPNHPVMLTAWTGHGTLFSTTALRRLNVRDDEPDPPGGFFARTPGTKTITGLAHEYAEFILRQRLSMMPDEQAQREMLERYATEAVAFGITSVQVMATNRPAADLARCAIDANLPIRMRVIDAPAGMSAWRRAASASARSAGLVTVSGTKMGHRRHARRTAHVPARSVLRQAGNPGQAELHRRRASVIPEGCARAAGPADDPRSRRRGDRRGPGCARAIGRRRVADVAAAHRAWRHA